MSETSIEFDTPLYLYFSDLVRKDKVRKEDIINILYETDALNLIVKLIADMNAGGETKIETSEGTIQNIYIKKGIRQSDLLRQFWFNLIMEKITQQIRTLDGYQMGNTNINSDGTTSPNLRRRNKDRNRSNQNKNEVSDKKLLILSRKIIKTAIK